MSYTALPIYTALSQWLNENEPAKTGEGGVRRDVFTSIEDSPHHEKNKKTVAGTYMSMPIWLNVF